MNRREEAIVTEMAGSTAVAVAPRANAEASPEANPDLDQIRALLQSARRGLYQPRPRQSHGVLY